MKNLSSTSQNYDNTYLGVAFITWGLLSSKIQFFNENEENVEPSVYSFKLLIIFSNLNSASFREGSRTSVKKACEKEIHIKVTQKHRINIYFVL